ncbi:MAG: hypothetical protein QOG04_1012 [Actinomycetota bacterium]|jgi:hypothetical protein|nr:hypothetical protein [Actinomycetota bacterium]
MKRNRFALAFAAVSLFVAALGNIAMADERAAHAPLKGDGENLKLVKNIQTGKCDSWAGTDHENVEFGKKTYSFATSTCSLAEGGGVHVIDITNPLKAHEVALVPCTVSQGDIQVSYDKKTLLLGHDSAGGPEACTGLGVTGFLTIDISNPLKPKVVGHATGDGAHNMTAHPTKPYVYVSNSSLVPGGSSHIQIWSIKNPAKPELINTIRSLPHAPHDISFNQKGTYAVTAAISHFDIFDTSDVENPTLVYESQCPGCSITHDAKFTPDDKHILIGDEGGGGGTYACPGGAWYVYDFSTPPVPVLTGIYEPAEFVVNHNGEAGSCTSHVFEISRDSTKIAISWYSLGTRYLDITTAIGVTVGANRAPTGIKECGWFVPEGGSSWSSKFTTDEKYITSNDEHRGFDIYKITDTECAG